MRRIFSIIALSFILARPAWADVIEYNSGKIVQGEIIKVTETGVTLRSGSDILGISYTQIRDIRESIQGRNSPNVDLARSVMASYASSDAGKRVASNQRAAAQPAQQASQSATRKEVTVYMTTWCGYCRQMIAFLNQQGIRYTAYDIEKNAGAKRDFVSRGGQGVPMVVVGNTVIRGYDPQAVLAALQ